MRETRVEDDRVEIIKVPVVVGRIPLNILKIEVDIHIGSDWRRGVRKPVVRIAPVRGIAVAVPIVVGARSADEQTCGRRDK